MSNTYSLKIAQRLRPLIAQHPFDTLPFDLVAKASAVFAFAAFQRPILQTESLQQVLDLVVMPSWRFKCRNEALMEQNRERGAMK
jgi:hypothetical protein